MQKLLLVVGIAVLALSAFALYETQKEHQKIQDKVAFTNWKHDFGRKYDSAEDTYRFGVFRANLKFINDNNEQAEDSLVLALNDFADLTTEEYEARYLSLIPSNKFPSNSIFTGEGMPIANEIDWNDKGAVTHVKNQGSCGSCWAFSTTGSVEGRIFQRDGTLPDLSEQELVDCAGGVYENQGCNGGWMDNAFKYIIDKGITTQESYPYTGRSGTCKVASPRYHITGFTDVQQKSKSAFEAAVTQQPVSVAINASSMWFQFYKSGVFKRSCSNKLNHGVLAVGLGTLKGVDFIRVKNSWGTTWGDSGFINMARLEDGDGQCGIYDSASFPQ